MKLIEAGVDIDLKTGPSPSRDGPLSVFSDLWTRDLSEWMTHFDVSSPPPPQASTRARGAPRLREVLWPGGPAESVQPDSQSEPGAAILEEPGERPAPPRARLPATTPAVFDSQDGAQQLCIQEDVKKMTLLVLKWV